MLTRLQQCWHLPAFHQSGIGVYLTHLNHNVLQYEQQRFIYKSRKVVQYDKLSKEIQDGTASPPLDQLDENKTQLYYRLRGQPKFWKFNYQMLHGEVHDWPADPSVMRLQRLFKKPPVGDDRMDDFLPKIKDPYLMDLKHWWELTKRVTHRHRSKERLLWPEKYDDNPQMAVPKFKPPPTRASLKRMTLGRTQLAYRIAMDAEKAKQKKGGKKVKK